MRSSRLSVSKVMIFPTLSLRNMTEICVAGLLPSMPHCRLAMQF